MLKTYFVVDVQGIAAELNFEQEFKEVISCISLKNKTFSTRAAHLALSFQGNASPPPVRIRIRRAC